MAEEKMPNMEPASSPQPAPVQPQPVAQAPQSGNSNNKTVLFVVGAVVLLVGGVAGYGYWNGSQIKNYAEDAEKVVKDYSKWATTLDIEENMSSLDSSLGFEDGYDEMKDEFDKTKKELEGIKATTEKSLADVSKKSVPGKAKSLDKDLKEYLNLAKQTSEEGIYAIEVANSALSVMDNMMNIEDDMYSGSMDEAAIMDEVAGIFDDWVGELKKINAPASVKEDHDKLVETLEDLVKKLKSGDTNAFNDVNNPFEGLDKMGDSEKSLERMKELEEKMSKDITSLKSVSFSF